MWLIKKVATATTSAVTYTKNLVVTPESPIQKLLKQTLDNDSQTMASTTKMNQLVTATFNIPEFEQANQLLYQRLRVFEYTQRQATRTLKTLQLVGYLLKHGASGFIDEMRNSLKMFKNYSQIPRKIIYTSPLDSEKQRYFDETLEGIEARAKNIAELLSEKQRLLKERDLAKLVQHKLATYTPAAGQTQNSASNSQRENEAKQQQSQFWSYVNSLDNKLENISASLHKKIETVVGRVNHQTKPNSQQGNGLAQDKDQVQPQNMNINRGQRPPDALFESIESNLQGVEVNERSTDEDFDQKLKSLAAEVQLL